MVALADKYKELKLSKIIIPNLTSPNYTDFLELFCLFIAYTTSYNNISLNFISKIR